MMTGAMDCGTMEDWRRQEKTGNGSGRPKNEDHS